MFFDNLKLEKELIIEEKRGYSEEHELHLHDVLEFHILLENEARFQLAHRQYEGRPGDVFLFRPFEPHWNLVKRPGEPIRWISILFSPSVMRFVPQGYKLLAPFYAVEAVSPHIPGSSPAAQAIHKLAAQALAEEAEKPIGWEARQFSLFVEILVETLRHTVAQRQIGESLDDGIIQAIETILAHFTEETDVNELIRLTGRQRTFFYQKFKAVTGVTPNAFIHRLRMQVATYLLANTDRSVTDVAFDCGYSTVQYFIQHFKAYRGVSPLQYRKSVR